MKGHPIFSFFYPFLAWIGQKMGLRERRAALLAGAPACARLVERKRLLT